MRDDYPDSPADDYRHREMVSVAGAFSDVARAEHRPTEWVIENILPVGLVIVCGPPKDAYKTTCLIGWAALLAGWKVNAFPPDWKPVRTGTSLLILHEDDAGEARVTLEKGMGVKTVADESVLIADEPDLYRLDEEEGRSQLFYWLEEREPTLLGIDPLANSHSIPENEAGPMIHLVAPLRRWAKRTKSTVVVNHHPRKLGEARAYTANDARGSSALFGAADAILTFTPQKEHSILIEAKFKRAKCWTKVVQLAIWESQGRSAGEALREIDETILKQIQHGFTRAQNIAYAIGVSLRTVKERLSFLESKGLVQPGLQIGTWRVRGGQ